MQALLNMNTGLRSRIKTEMYFPNYSPDELCQIFISMSGSGIYPFQIAPDAMDALKHQFLIESKRTDFANARDVRNALDHIIDIHANHFAGSGGTMEKNVITLQDVIAYSEERKNLIKRNYTVQNKLLVPLM